MSKWNGGWRMPSWLKRLALAAVGREPGHEVHDVAVTDLVAPMIYIAARDAGRRHAPNHDASCNCMECKKVRRS